MRERRAMYYKAFDFKSGRTYLIGQYKTKMEAEAWYETQGMAVIAKTVVPMEIDEYIEAYQNRPDREQRNDEIEALIEIRNLEKLQKEVLKEEKKRTAREYQKEYQHQYYMKVTKPGRLAMKRNRKLAEVTEEIGSERKEGEDGDA